ncbi:putative disease resistance RPP13-like protein 1 [Glycine soja]|uniref:Putative disease resistance RPP13-like protein 1 n=1 Tax=Glycine soja TaxID=3848 RepID=A0A445F135_GLYSO|nr:putative disease resistance RPP13-like protein 1 [Glycine soja]
MRKKKKVLKKEEEKTDLRARENVKTCCKELQFSYLNCQTRKNGLSYGGRGTYLCFHGDIEILLNRIASREFQDFFSSRKLNVFLLDELKIKLLALNVVLNDAEEKQIIDLAVKAWLDELKNVVYDAKDLLDEINIKSLR